MVKNLSFLAPVNPLKIEVYRIFGKSNRPHYIDRLIGRKSLVL